MNPHAIVEVGGRRWDSWRDKSLFMGVLVELTTDKASKGEWKVFDPEFELIDQYSKPDGVEMLPMRFWLGFGEDLGEPVFKGLLTSIRRDDSSTTLIAFDMGIKMRLQKRTQYHNRMNALQIIRRLAERNGLRFEGPDNPIQLEPVRSYMQDARTDWEQASELARDNGLVLFVRGDTLFAKEPARIGAPKVTLTYKKDLSLLRGFDLEFKLPEDQDGRHREVEVRGRGRGGRRLSGRSSRNQRGTTRVEITRDLPRHTRRAASRRAEARKELEREHAFTLRVQSVPPPNDARADARDTVALRELGKIFSGDYLCDTVTHELSSNRFVTRYDLYRDVKAA